jgi:hypothetical protein
VKVSDFAHHRRLEGAIEKAGVDETSLVERAANEFAFAESRVFEVGDPEGTVGEDAASEVGVRGVG